MLSSFRFACPHCSAVLTVPESAAGQSVACPNCLKPTNVPSGLANLVSPPSRPWWYINPLLLLFFCLFMFFCGCPWIANFQQYGRGKEERLRPANEEPNRLEEYKRQR